MKIFNLNLHFTKLNSFSHLVVVQLISSRCSLHKIYVYDTIREYIHFRINVSSFTYAYGMALNLVDGCDCECFYGIRYDF